jgi:AcrR family transcriptional regulator
VNASDSNARVGRPRSETAGAHAEIMDAVYALLQERSVRDLSMEIVAKRAGVSKPTLYKWWPTKAALILAMFHERMVGSVDLSQATTTEAIIRAKARHLADAFNGLFGKVTAELIAEGQSEPAVLQELFDSHISERRQAAIADIERGKRDGELSADANPELIVDAIFGTLYYRLLLRLTPLTREYADSLVDLALKGLRTQPREA